MKQRTFIFLLTLLTAIVISYNFILDENDGGSHFIINAASDTCGGTGSEIYDDGSFETFGVQDLLMPEMGIVLKFQPSSYPWKYNTFCVAFTGTSDTGSLIFDIVIYDSNPATGLPQNLIGTKKNCTATPIPLINMVKWFSYDISGLTTANTLTTPGSSLYFGIKYNNATHSPKYVGIDATVKKRSGYFSTSGGSSWIAAEQFIGNYRCWGMRTLGASPVTQTTPTYTLTAKNFRTVSCDTILWDINFKNTGADRIQYSTGQYFFNFNPLIINGNISDLKYEMESTNITGWEPRNPSISGSILRLANNTPHTGLFIPAFSEVKIVTVRLIAKGKQFNFNESLNLSWRNSVNPFTKIFAYIGSDTTGTEITDSTKHFIIGSITPCQITIPDVTMPFCSNDSLSAAIPDSGGDSNSANDVITISNIPSGRVIKKITVTIDSAVHPWIGDLKFLLIKDTSGIVTKSVTLIDRPWLIMDIPNGSSANNFIGIILDDDVADSIKKIGPGPELFGGTTDPDASPDSTFKPSSPLSVFIGDNPNGNYKLRISDYKNGDVGTLYRWCITITYGQ